MTVMCNTCCVTCLEWSELKFCLLYLGEAYLEDLQDPRLFDREQGYQNVHGLHNDIQYLYTDTTDKAHVHEHGTFS